MSSESVSTDYEYFKHNNHKIVVEGAIRDGEGYRISTTYPKKVDILVRPQEGQNIIVIHHGLNNAPSSVSLYIVHHTNPLTYEMIDADITVTDADIRLNFIELPEVPAGETLELLVRSLI